ncbi:MAG TPA: hypothetical protein PLH03_01185 [Methylophilaceae bacterium]|nr:hypothetical protein [Methylophilaceae bacterium]
MKRVNRVMVVVLGLAGAVSLPAQSDDLSYGLPGYINRSVIDANALSDVRGRFAVNMAAGDSNAQVNAGALAINPDGGLAAAQVMSHQAVGSIRATAPNLSFAIIGDHAFANSVGAISVNQTSGVGNTQANGMAFAVGFEVESVSESKLAATASGIGLEGSGSSTGVKTASISDTAFEGSRGLIQINQSAGSGNSTANNFAFQLQLGAKP